MSSLAVSALALIAVLSGDVQTELSPHENEVWRRLQPCFATLMNRGLPGGTAALIDSSGLFLSYQNSSNIRPTVGMLSDGRAISFIPVATDAITHSVLLQAQGWRPEFGIPVRVPEGDEVGHGVVFAVLQSGPIRASYTTLSHPGIFHEERRIIPFNEVRFESPQEGCAGALLIDEDGELLGVLGATLARDGSGAANNGGFQNQSVQTGVFQGGGGIGGGLAGRGRTVPNMHAQLRMGPSNLMVAYTAGIVVLRRVVSGFKSPEHRVTYPSIGLYCKDTPGGGALVQAVQPFSPAEQANIQPGDVLTSIAGSTIRDQVDFALVMLHQNPGDKILIRYRRGRKSMVQELVVAHS